MRSGAAFKTLVFACILLSAYFTFSLEAFGLEIRSSAFKEGGFIPQRYTGRGEDISPGLDWKDVPEGTKSFVLIMDDPDAPMGTWVHWVAYNIPAGARKLGEAVPQEAVLDDGTHQGVNSFRRGRIGYRGPYPPPGPAHRYMFKLYAIDKALDLDPGATKDEVIKAMRGHILEKAQLTGLFKR